MKKTSTVKISISLMIISMIMICLAFTYQSLENKVINYKYSDNDEYSTVKEGMDFINDLPLQFNVINKYFSDINNLEREEKEQILFSYIFKNNYKLIDCSTSVNYPSYCIKLNDVNSNEIKEIFNMKLDINSNDVNVFLDKYGSTKVVLYGDYYKFNINTYSVPKYESFNRFKKYKQDGDSYVFYVYQGYINTDVKEDEELILYDYITGKVIHKGISDGYKNFKGEKEEDYNKLQLYKYELKKNNKGNFYLYGYNPVRDID